MPKWRWKVQAAQDACWGHLPGWLFAGLAVAFCSFSLFQFKYHFVNENSDVAHVTQVARNLMEGKGYQTSCLEQFYMPVHSPERPEDTWPLAVPTVLAGSMALFGDNAYGWFVPNLLAALITALFVRHIIAYFSSSVHGNLGGAFYLIFYAPDGLLNLSNTITSLCFLGYGYTLYRFIYDNKVRWLVGSGILGGLLLLFRSENFILIIGFCPAYFLAAMRSENGKQKITLTAKRIAPTLIISGVLFLPYAVWNWAHFATVLPPVPHYSYTAHRFLGWRWAGNFAIRYHHPYRYAEIAQILGGWPALLARDLRIVFEALITFGGDYGGLLVPTVLLAVLIPSSEKRIRLFAFIFVVPLLLHLGILTCWVQYVTRYFYYLLAPATVVLFVSGATLLSAYDSDRVRPVKTLVCVILLIGSMGFIGQYVMGAMGARTLNRLPDEVPWILENTTPDDIIMTPYIPQVVCHHSGRRIIGPPSGSVEDVLSIARLYNVRYLILRKAPPEYIGMRPEIAAILKGKYPLERMSIKESTPTLNIYEFK